MSSDRLEKPDKRKLFIHCVLIAALGFAAYINSFGGEFVWDDLVLIRDNQYITGPSGFSEITAGNLGAGSGKRFSIFRPLQMLSYRADYLLWKLNTKGFHLTNTLLHVLTALCLYFLISALFNNRVLSLVTSALFVIHPVHTQAVSYISGRADPLSALLILGCLTLYVKNEKAKRLGFYIPALLCFSLALFARENSLIVPALIPLCCFAIGKNVSIKRLLPFLGIACLYITARMTFLTTLLPHTVSSTSALERLPGFFSALAHYAKLLVWPFDLHAIYGEKLFTWPDFEVAAGLVIFILLIAAFARLGKSNKLIFFSAAWFFIALIPQSNILYPVKNYMAEHWLYLPSVGFFLAIGYLITKYAKAADARSSDKKNLKAAYIRPLSFFLISYLAVFYLTLTIVQNRYWRNPLVLYKRTLEYSPKNARMGVNLANTYYAGGEKEKAVALYKKAIIDNPRYADAYYNLGSAYSDMGKVKEAVTILKKAVSLNPNYAHAYNNLGNAYSRLGNQADAIRAYKKAVAVKSDYADAYHNMGRSYFIRSRFADAADVLEKAVEIDPEHAFSHKQLAITYYNLGEFDLAVKHSDIAMRLGCAIKEEVLAKLRGKGGK